MSYNYGSNPQYNYGNNDPMSILRRFDVNGDGNITESDFVIAARELGLGWAEEQKMRQVFRTLDRNGNGRLDYNEALEAVNLLNGQRGGSSSYTTTSSPYTSTAYSTYSSPTTYTTAAPVAYTTAAPVTYTTSVPAYGTSSVAYTTPTAYTSHPVSSYGTSSVAYTTSPVAYTSGGYSTANYGGRDPMAILRRLDVNGDGNITESDFIIAARELGLDWAGELQMRNTFKQLDRNGNGRLDYNEALEAVRLLDSARR